MYPSATNYVSNLSAVTTASVLGVWATILRYLPQILGALIILVIGWIFASVVGSLVTRLVRMSGIDDIVDRAGLNARLHTSKKYRILSGVLGQFVKWFIILATLIAAANSLNLPQITEFLNQVALYIPRAIVAVVILTVGFLLSDFVAGLLRGGLQASQLPVRHKDLLPNVAKYAIIVFSIMAALVQLNIVPELVQILFAGLVLALALAFGLGGRDEAARFLARLRQSS